MEPFEFILIASGLDRDDDGVEDRLYEAGCDDATLSWQKGVLVLEFARDAESFSAAVESAMAAVRIVGGSIERLEPDPLVSLADIAVRTGLTRAAISLYATGGRGAGFPPPVSRVTTPIPLWDWVRVANWLHRNGKLDRASVLRAREIRALNGQIEAYRRDVGDEAA